MNIRLIYGYIIAVLFLLLGCKKEFLDKKPSSNILTPTSLSDLNALLENQNVMNMTGALPQLSADEYQVTSDKNFLSLSSPIQRNSYIWARDIYQGQIVKDWEIPFTQIFYANSVLQVLNEIPNKDSGKNFTKGWALFARAYAYFDLARNFCPIYNVKTAETDLGLPLRITPGVDQTVKRASLQKTFDLILSDLSEAFNLLGSTVPAANKNRPSKPSVLALKARILLYMGNYRQAGIYADSTLLYHSKLIDYNTVSRTSDTPFSDDAEEVIYQSNQIVAYGTSSSYGNQSRIEVNPELINTYSQGDLRKPIYFGINSSNKYFMKRGYVSGGFYAFTGLATDEIILIQAECLARQGKVQEAMDALNTLLKNRYDNALPYTSQTANSITESLTIILKERQKELVWRALRWSDLKRLNRDGENIKLKRTISGQSYTLTANDPKYVFAIPDNEISLSGIIQNPR